MKVVILAGGFGTRLSEFTHSIPKPMVSVGGKPILWHIMSIYAKYGFKDFVVALGYKSEIIKDYFLNYSALASDFTVSLANNHVTYHSSSVDDWNVTLIDTGIETMTGGRLLRLKPYLGSDPFMLTYGDGLSNININTLLDFHCGHNKLVTISAVHPNARFGELKLDGDIITSFAEKPQTDDGWINGGFFVIEPSFLDYIDSDSTVLESSPLETAALNNELVAYKHTGFWQCMDSKRDLDYLNSLCSSGSFPWLIDEI